MVEQSGFPKEAEILLHVQQNVGDQSCVVSAVFVVCWGTRIRAGGAAPTD